MPASSTSPIHVHRQVAARSSWIAAVTLLAFVFQGCPVADGSRSEQELYSRLVVGYNRQLRPVKRPDDPVRVVLGVSLVEVVGLDEGLNHITVKLWLTLRWEDQYLRWDPRQYGGVRRMNFATGQTSAKIWTPDIVLRNALKSETVPDTDAVATFDGTVTWVRPVIYSVASSHEFRGNSWSAAFRFSSWTYDRSLLDLQPAIVEGSGGAAGVDGAAAASTRGIRSGGSGGEADGVSTLVVRMDTENFAPNDLWALLENNGSVEMTPYPCCPSEPYTTVNYTLKLRKKIGPSLLGRRGR